MYVDLFLRLSLAAWVIVLATCTWELGFMFHITGTFFVYFADYFWVVGFLFDFQWFAGVEIVFAFWVVVITLVVAVVEWVRCRIYFSSGRNNFFG